MANELGPIDAAAKFVLSDQADATHVLTTAGASSLESATTFAACALSATQIGAAWFASLPTGRPATGRYAARRYNTSATAFSDASTIGVFDFTADASIVQGDLRSGLLAMSRATATAPSWMGSFDPTKYSLETAPTLPEVVTAVNDDMAARLPTLTIGTVTHVTDDVTVAPVVGEGDERLVVFVQDNADPPNPLAGALVRVVNGTTYSQRSLTDGSGTSNTFALPAGTFDVNATLSNYTGTVTRVIVPTSGQVTLTLVPESTIATPDDVTKTTGYFIALDQNNTPAGDIQYQIKLAETPSGAAGFSPFYEWHDLDLSADGTEEGVAIGLVVAPDLWKTTDYLVRRVYADGTEGDAVKVTTSDAGTSDLSKGGKVGRLKAGGC